LLRQAEDSIDRCSSTRKKAERKYGHPILLAKTFVERNRFAGTSYKAANWIRVGSTTGRSRQDRKHTLQVPVKDVYVYPLCRRFREELSA
jgi:hypothetical protein